MTLVSVSEESSRGRAQAGTSGAALLRSAVRRDIVDTLAGLPDDRRDDGLSAAQLGDLVGLHVTTVRFHLTQLIDGGLLTTHSVRSPGAGRPTKKYRVATGSLEQLPDAQAHRMLAALLAESFDARDADGVPLTPEEVGRDWARRHVAADSRTATARTPGEWLTSVGRMIDVLHTWGYTPNLRTEDSGRTVRIDLVDCPFLSLAHNHPEVVCGIHRGLMRGTLDAFGETDAELSLEPFVDETLCRAHITTRSTFDHRGGTS